MNLNSLSLHGMNLQRFSGARSMKMLYYTLDSLWIGHHGEEKYTIYKYAISSLTDLPYGKNQINFSTVPFWWIVEALNLQGEQGTNTVHIWGYTICDDIQEMIAL